MRVATGLHAYASRWRAGQIRGHHCGGTPQAKLSRRLSKDGFATVTLNRVFVRTRVSPAHASHDALTPDAAL